jgi:thioredoxin-like negative regulator of GroEL
MTRNTRKNTKKNAKKNKVHFESRVTVHKIEPSNASKFQEELNNMNGPVLVHSPSCIHCIQLRPKWNQMIKELNNRKVNCKILEINADVLHLTKNSLAERIHAVPTIINMEKGKENDIFSDEKNVNNMLQFVLKHLKGNENLPYNYNLNKKGNIKKITNPNNVKKLRSKFMKPKTKRYTKKRKPNTKK